MRKHISFTIAATIAGLVMFFWINAGVVESNADAARPAPSSLWSRLPRFERPVADHLGAAALSCPQFRVRADRRLL